MNTIQSQNYSQFQNPNNRNNMGPQDFQNNSKTYNFNYDQTVISQNVPTQHFDPTRFGMNQGTYNDNTRMQSKVGEREVMGDTIASMDVTNMHNRTAQTNFTNKMGEREIMGDTIASMDYTQGDNLGNTGYNDYDQNMSRNNYNRQSSYDEKPINSSGQYNYQQYMSDQAELDQDFEAPDPKSFEKNKQPNTNNAVKKGMNNTIKEDEMEEFPDDFEEYLSEGNIIILIL